MIGGLVNLGLVAATKVGAGVLWHSQALVAAGIHSLSDLLSDVLVWYVGRRAAQAPDLEHPYGHGRYETLATLVLGVLLLAVAGDIGWDAGKRLFAPDELLRPELPALAAALVFHLGQGVALLVDARVRASYSLESVTRQCLASSFRCRFLGRGAGGHRRHPGGSALPGCPGGDRYRCNDNAHGLEARPAVDLGTGRRRVGSGAPSRDQKDHRLRRWGTEYPYAAGAKARLAGVGGRPYSGRSLAECFGGPHDRSAGGEAA